MNKSNVAAVIVLAGAIGMAGPGVTAEAAVPAHCYAWPAERLDVARGVAGRFRSADVMVTEGSPCRDINVRGVQDIRNGRAVCRSLRVRWNDTGRTTTWRQVCTGWKVLAYGAAEGRVYQVEQQRGNRPVTVVVRG